MMILMLIALLILIIQDIRSRTISLYNLCALTLCAILLDLFCIESAFIGFVVLTAIGTYAYLGLKKPILECIGNGDIILLALICSITPFFLSFGLPVVQNGMLLVTAG